MHTAVNEQPQLLRDHIYSYFTYSGMVPYRTQRFPLLMDGLLLTKGWAHKFPKSGKMAFCISSNTTNPCQPIPPYREGFVIKTASKTTTTTNRTQLIMCHSYQQIPMGLSGLVNKH